MEIPEKKFRFLFRLSLFAKGAFALVEVLGGILAYFVSQQFLLSIATTVTQNEFAGDAHDLVAQYLIQLAQNFSVSAQLFTAFYLILHGAIKCVLIVGLLKERYSFYPISLVVFTIFIVYQLFRFTHTHSPWLVVISVLDLFVLALIWYEYRKLMQSRANSLLA